MQNDKIQYVRLGGVTIRRATAFNAAYIRDNKIGPGTILEIVRSGDVIPYIKRVVKGTKAALPPAKQFGEWDWNDTGVDAVLVGDDNEDHIIQRLVHTFTAAHVENFSEGLIRRFYAAGYTTTAAILKLAVPQMVKNIDGIQAASAQKIRAELDKRFTDIPMATLMYASGCFGRNFGSTKLKAIYDQYKDDAVFGWRNFKLNDIAAAIGTLPGFSYETGKQYAAGIKPFLKFLADHKGLIKPATYTAPKRASSKLSNVSVCFTGFRDQLLEDAIQANGGKVVGTVSNKTTVLLVKSVGSGSLKEQKALDLGVAVMTAQQFKKKYGV